MRGIILSVICWGLSAAAWAEPSSLVAWTPTTLKFVKQGNAENGKTLANGCVGCHNKDNAAPNLDGQLPTYLYKQLLDYRNGSRKDPTGTMNGMAAALLKDDQAVADVSAWYAQQPPMKGPGGASDSSGIVAVGDGKRMEPACASCHGRAGQGEKVDTPRLSGQKAGYLEQTLLGYKSKARGNDIYSRMRLIASKLSEQEIKLLAEYYSKLD
ncbi:MAG: c-type cytochrome [Candidatus Methylumidiphilus sp.]